MNAVEKALREILEYESGGYSIPEKVLVAAILELAYRDLLSNFPHLYKRAISWFLCRLPRDRCTPLFYFLDCCEILELSSSQIQFLKNQAKEKATKTASVKGMLQSSSKGSNVPPYSAFSNRIRVVRYRARARKIKEVA